MREHPKPTAASTTSNRNIDPLTIAFIRTPARGDSAKRGSAYGAPCVRPKPATGVEMMQEVAWHMTSPRPSLGDGCAASTFYGPPQTYRGSHLSPTQAGRFGDHRSAAAMAHPSCQTSLCPHSGTNEQSFVSPQLVSPRSTHNWYADKSVQNFRPFRAPPQELKTSLSESFRLPMHRSAPTARRARVCASGILNSTLVLQRNVDLSPQRPNLTHSVQL
jgi:hypothetical protein